MGYLHEKEIENNLIYHWANESESAEDEVATFKIKQIETGIIYDEAIDVIPCQYTYEVMDIKIEDDVIDDL